MDGGGGDVERAVESARAMGVPEPALTALRAREQARAAEEAVALWPENIIPTRLFLAMLTQWRMGPGGPVGLDYAVIAPTARLLGLDIAPGNDEAEMFAGLQELEQAALEIMAARNRRNRGNRNRRG